MLTQYVICAVLFNVGIGASLNLTLPAAKGPYNVGSRPYVLNHTTLNDPTAPNNITTSILLNIYYPTHDPAPAQKYIWKGLADYYEEYFSLQSGAFGNITANIAYNASPLPASECEKGRLPTLIWGPPFAGPPSQLFLGLISEMVSRGHIVVSVDHPYEQPYVQYPDGTGINGHPVDWDPPMDVILRVHEYRIVDTSAVLDTLPLISNELKIPFNLTHFAFFGHSIGGSVALSQIPVEKSRTSSSMKKFLGAINLDGQVLGRGAANSSSVDVHEPVLLFASSGHQRTGDHSWPLFESFQSSWTKELRLLGNSNHTDFSDLIFLKQANGIAGGDGAILAARALEVIRMFVGDFLGMIMGKGEGVLRGDQEVQRKWPEVVFEFNNSGDPCAPDLC